MRKAKAFAPAAISSFFAIHDTQNGKPISNLEEVGAIGGGFGLRKGVATSVTIEEAQNNRIDITINSKPAPAKTTRKVAETLLSKTTSKHAVIIEHKIEVPVGTGFGTSAGGALTTGLALAHALELPLTYNQIGAIAHVAEIECHTGLGTVSSLTFAGGCPLVVKPGAPGICVIDRIPLTSNYVVVAGYFKSTKSTKTVLSDPNKKRQINLYGKETLDAILAKPNLENFLACCWQFAQNAAFATENVRKFVDLAKQAGAVGAAQNMIGEAVHAVTSKENTAAVEEAFKQVLPQEQVLVSELDFQGARLLT